MLLLLPPCGLVLLWLRRRVRLVVKLLMTLVCAVLTIVYLHVFFGLRVQFAGNMGLIVEFWKPRSHIARLERQRAAMEGKGTADRSKSILTDGGPRQGGAVPWPGFRGPTRDGIVPLTGILTQWPPRGLRQLWRQPIGEGYASFAIGYGGAYTIEQRHDQEVVTCYDLVTGLELWAFSYAGHFQEVLGGPGPRATPTLDDDRLFALGAVGDLHCLDAATGEFIWHANILRDNQADNLHWGMSGSPLVDGDLVIVTPGGRSGNLVAAYDRYSGRPVWRGGDGPSSYSSPMIATLAGRRQILVFGGSALSAHALDDGRELWRYPWVTQQGINVCQPIVLDDDRVFISSGYDHGSALLQLTVSEETFKVKRLWSSKGLKAKFASAVLHDGFIYGLDEAILVCLEADSGQRCWKGGRYGYGQLLLVGESLVILSENGELARVRATPERYQEVSRFQAIEGKTWNHPAIADGKVLVRNAREMACFELPVERSHPY